MPRTNTMRDFWSRVEIVGECWLWRGWVRNAPLGQGGGYGHFRLDGRQQRVHRLAYEYLVGDIPDDLTIDHLCRNRSCVRPDHLEVVTPIENTLRGVSPPSKNRRKSRCVNGHEFTESNTYRPPNNQARRECRACKDLRNKMRAASFAALDKGE